MTTEECLKQGDLPQALKLLQNQVRSQPADVNHRVFLFQLLCVQGQWDRALTQLNVAADLDDSTLAMAAMYREVLSCEALRERVFQGRTEPMIFGEPEEWLVLMIQALKLTAEQRYDEAQILRAQAFEQAPVTTGTLDGQPFEWIADSDSRFGPVLETIVEGRYLWVPMHRICSIQIEVPVDLRDTVWVPARFKWRNEGECYGLIPSRYPLSHLSGDSLIQLSRKTEWDACGEECYRGLGQRMLATHVDEYPLLDIRHIQFNLPDQSKELASDG